MRAVTWNLFHGRDHPPEELGRLWLPGERRGKHYAQLNRSLKDEFADRLAALEWDVALLQECPPRWLDALGSAAHAAGASVLTSRNWLAPLRARLADWNPDAIASNEGGSNVTLVRAPWRITGTQRLTLARLPERRRALLTLLEAGDGRRLTVVNLHATAAGDHTRAAHELLRTGKWAGSDSRVLVGGDMNLRPREHPWAFEELATRHGLTGATSDDAVDHLLARGMRVLDPPQRLPDAQREVVRADGLRIRLSDHAIVTARYEVA